MATERTRILKIRAEVFDGEVYINRDDLIREMERTVPLTMSVMAVRFVAAFAHALKIALPDLGGRERLELPKMFEKEPDDEQS